MSDAYQQGWDDYYDGTHWPPYGSAGEEYRRGWRDAESVDLDDDDTPGGET